MTLLPSPARRAASRPGSVAVVLAFFAVLMLQGCASLGSWLDGPTPPKAGPQTASASTMPTPASSAPAQVALPAAGAASAAANQAVRVEIEAPSALKALLERHLDLVRLGRLPREEVDGSEWSRLIDAAPAQVRDLLQTEGFFNPVVKLEREGFRGLATASGADATDRAETVRLQVDPGKPAQVDRLRLEVQGELQEGEASGDGQSRAVMAQIRRQWELPEGANFRNPTWGNAKAALVAQMRAAGYANASLVGTKADVDAATDSVRLFVVADSGPLYRYGVLDVEGLVEQDIETVRNLMAAPRGAPVTEALLLDFQDRLQKAGLFENIGVTLDPDPNQAGNARITARLREAPLQTYTLGLGISANTGPRASVEHIYRRVFGFPLLSRNKAEYGNLRRAWDGEISTHAGESLYRNLVGGAVEQLESDTDIVLSQRLRVGRTQEGQRIERLLFVEGERSVRKTLDEVVRTQASAVSLNFHGVWRDLDSVVLPTQGFSLKGQLGAGHSRGTDAVSGPFSRVYLRFTGYQPVARSWYSQARLEVGQVFLRSNQVVPESQQFRAGGDDSVRGYSYRSLGPVVDGAVGSGNVMFTFSGEVARPISASLPSVWGATFIDLGNAGNSFSGLKPALGAGVGVRWRSPVGPLRIDWAYGRETRKSRIHFSVGIAL